MQNYNMIKIYNEYWYIAKMAYIECHLRGVKIQNFPGGMPPTPQYELPLAAKLLLETVDS